MTSLELTQINDLEKASATNNAVVPIQVHWEDLLLEVEVKSNKLFKKEEVKWKPILKGVSGSVDPGSLLAIMGTSGAGKTTLLNVLAGRIHGRLGGNVWYNGHLKKDAKGLKKQTAYVMQDDLLMASLTPRETFDFAAKLRIPGKSNEDKRIRVNEVIKELNLNGCQNTRVGSPGLIRGVSGGERKRVSIGSEIINNPSLIFLDEPTSGLDSFTAENVMTNLRDLARSGRTIICTINQPNSDIFQLFDQLMLLADGECVYFGKASKAVEYFASLGYQCPQYVNPTDYFMKLVHSDESKESKDRVNSLIQSYKKSNEYAELRKIKPKERQLINEDDDRSNKSYPQGVITQLGLLTKRSFTDLYRDPLKLRAGFGQTIFMALLLGLIYLQLGNGQVARQDRLGALFFLMVSVGMSSTNSVVATFPQDKHLFFREHSNHMYRPTVFYISKIVAELPNQIIMPWIFSTIVYWMIGFNSDPSRYFTFVLVSIFATWCGSSIGMFVGVIAKDTSVAISLVPLILIPFMIFSGFFVNSETVPAYFSWIEYISFIKYAFRAVALNEMRGFVFTCTDQEKIMTINGPQCRTQTGEQVINELGMNGSNVWEDVFTMLGLYIAIRIVTYLFLMNSIRSKSKSKSK